MAGRAGNTVNGRVLVTVVAMGIGETRLVRVGVVVQQIVAVAIGAGNAIDFPIDMATVAMGVFVAGAVRIGMGIQSGSNMANAATFRLR